MLPLATEMDWIPSKSGIKCWFRSNNKVYLQLHHAFLSNLGPIQTILLIIIDLAFIVKFRQHFHQHINRENHTDRQRKDNKKFNRYRLLFISAASYTLLATVQCIFLSIARLSSVHIIKFEKGLAYNVSDILWYLNILRGVLDFVIYQKCFRIFDVIILKLSVISFWRTLATRSSSLYTGTGMTTE
ncbi:unnamed protein product [Trichobilharzia szidati]|nr:unnamed protein product [Trichobilharzia szidati]